MRGTTSVSHWLSGRRVFGSVPRERAGLAKSAEYYAGKEKSNKIRLQESNAYESHLAKRKSCICLCLATALRDIAVVERL